MINGYGRLGTIVLVLIYTLYNLRKFLPLMKFLFTEQALYERKKGRYTNI